MYAFAREYLADVLPFLAARCDEEETEADNDDLPIHVRARLLREIAARRQMIDAAQRVLDNFHDPRRTDDEVMPLRRQMAVWAQAMHCIAPIWRDHKEFKREFLTRPSTADL